MLTKGSSHKAPVCYQCGKEEHIKARCPNNPDTQANNCTVPRAGTPKKRIALPCCLVVLNGQEVSALGSMHSLVSSDFDPSSTSELCRDDAMFTGRKGLIQLPVLSNNDK